MQTLLLSKPGTGLRVSDRELLVVESGEVSARYRPYRTGFDQVLIEENGGFVTFAALRWLSAQGISFAGVRFNGNLDFVTIPSAPTSGPVKVAQARVAASSSRSLALAHALVRARIAGHAVVLGRPTVNPRLPLPGDLLHLRGYEGRVTDQYFRALGIRVAELWPDSGYTRRSKSGSTGNSMNAVDGPNCLLNFGFAVLASRVLTATVRAGFDPSVSFYHEASARGNTPPLVRDLIEPFRFLAELAVLDTLRAEKFQGRDFQATSDFVLRLGSRAKQTLLAKLSGRLNRKVRYGDTRRTYETIMVREFGRLAEHICGPLNNRFSFKVPLDSSMVHQR